MSLSLKIMPPVYQGSPSLLDSSILEIMSRCHVLWWFLTFLISFTFCSEVPAEPEQTDDTAVLITENTESQCCEREEDPEILQQSHEGPTGPREEPETWKDIDRNVDQPEPAEEKAELQKGTQRNEEDVEKSQDVLEESSLEENTRDSQTPERPENFDRLEMTDGLTQDKEQRSEEFEQLQYFKLLTTKGAAQPEKADVPDTRAAGETAQAEQQEEQTEPSEQKEPTSHGSQDTPPEQLVQPRETDEPQITEQLPAESEAMEQTAEGESGQDHRATPSLILTPGGGGSVRGSAERLLADGEQLNSAEPSAPCVNGCELDGERARRLAQRLFKLDGFQRVDVAKHLDKE